MFEYLKGTFTAISATQLVVDCNGVGFDVSISLHTYAKIKDATEGLILIHQSIKEDAHTLYGFAEAGERKMFRHLITVSGVGTNTARIILSSFTPDEIHQAILNGDVVLLQRIKGIGNKTAQRIILDLKDKLSREPRPEGVIINASGNTPRQEALSALLVLGFARQHAEKALDSTLKKNASLGVEQLIKEALALM